MDTHGFMETKFNTVVVIMQDRQVSFSDGHQPHTTWTKKKVRQLVSSSRTKNQRRDATKYSNRMPPERRLTLISITSTKLINSIVFINVINLKKNLRILGALTTFPFQIRFKRSNQDSLMRTDPICYLWSYRILLHCLNRYFYAKSSILKILEIEQFCKS